MVSTRVTHDLLPPCMLQQRKQQIVGPARSRLVTPQSSSDAHASSTGGSTIAGESMVLGPASAPPAGGAGRSGRIPEEAGGVGDRGLGSQAAPAASTARPTAEIRTRMLT